MKRGTAKFNLFASCKLPSAICICAAVLFSTEINAHTAAECSKALEGISAKYRELHKECTLNMGRFLQGIPDQKNILTADEMEVQQKLETLQKEATAKSNSVLGLLLGEDSPESIEKRLPRASLKFDLSNGRHFLSIDGNGLQLIYAEALKFNINKYVASGILPDNNLGLTFSDGKLIAISVLTTDDFESLPEGTDFGELQKSFNSKYKKLSAVVKKTQANHTLSTTTTHRWLKDDSIAVQITQTDGVITNKNACLALASTLMRFADSTRLGVQMQSECLDGKTSTGYTLSYFLQAPYKTLMSAVATQAKVDKDAAIKEEADSKRKKASGF